MRAHPWLRSLKNTFGHRQPRGGKRPARRPAFAPSLESLEARLAPAVTFVVNTLLDTHLAQAGSTNGLDTNGNVSLRSALEAAENFLTPTAVTIDLTHEAGVIPLSLGELAFGSANDNNLTITGADNNGTPALTVRQTDGKDRIFEIDPAAAGHVTATISDVTLQGGFAASGTAPRATIGGGAILGGGPSDALNLTNDTFTGNASDAGANGGAVAWFGGGDLNVSGSTFTNNTSTAGVGGAVFFQDSGSAGNLSITNSLFQTNTARASNSVPGQGGALFAGVAAGSTATLSTTGFDSNVAESVSTSPTDPQGQGGAIYFLGDQATANASAGTATITDNILTNNKAEPAGGSSPGQGGAVFVEGGNLSLSFSQLGGNVAATGSAIDNSSDNPATVSAADDWWGTDAGPGGFTAGTVAAPTWLVLTYAANPATLGVGQTSTLTADFTHDNTGANVAASDPAAGHAFPAFIGLPVSYGTVVGGTLSNQQTSIQAGGTATATYTATTAGPGSSTVTVDGATATAVLTVLPSANIQVTNTDNATNGHAVPGTAVTYTITVHNPGPSDVTGVTFADAFPSALGGVSYTVSASGGATGATSGSGNINQTLNLPVGSSVTYTVPATISPSATGTLSQTATATVPAGVVDTDAHQSSATDTLTLTPQANLQISNSAPATVTAATNLTYTITVTNPGPSDAQNVVLANILPAGETYVSLTQSTGTPNVTVSSDGTHIADAVGTLASGASITFTLKVLVGAGAVNTLLDEVAGVTASDLAPGDTGNIADARTAVVAPVIAITANPTVLAGKVGIRLSDTFTAGGGTGPYQYFFTAGSLPAGLSLNATTGVLSGVPQHPGTFHFTVTAVDANHFGGSTPFTLTVQQGDVARLVFLNQLAALPLNALVGPVVVAALDQFNNPLSGVVVKLGLVPVTSTGAAGFVPGSVLQATTVGGVATFGRIGITARGVYALRASVGGVSALMPLFEVGVAGRHAPSPVLPPAGVVGPVIGRHAPR